MDLRDLRDLKLVFGEFLEFTLIFSVIFRVIVEYFHVIIEKY